MDPTQIGRSVCLFICHSRCTWWNEMGVRLYFEGTATHLIIETPQIMKNWTSEYNVFQSGSSDNTVPKKEAT
jgi:hypothetical protein